MEEILYHYDKSEMGKRLKEIRKGKYTQETLADVLQVSVDSISKYERGLTEIPNDIIGQLCTLFQVSSDYFLFGKKTQDLEINENYIDSRIAELIRNLNNEEKAKAFNILAAFVA